MPDPNQVAATETPAGDPAAPAEGTPAATEPTPTTGDPLAVPEDDTPKKKAPKRKPKFVPIAVTLPPAVSDDDSPPTLLGDVTVPADQRCTIELIGGESAVPGAYGFVMKPASDPSVRRWQVQLLENPKDPNPAKAVEFEVRDDKLWFRWVTDALNRARSEYIRNCALRVTVDRDTKYFMLRKPLEQPSISAKFDEAVAISWDIPYAPDAKAMFVEFAFPEQVFTDYSFEPRDRLMARRETTWAAFGSNKDQQGFRFKLDTQTTDEQPNKVNIMITPFFKVGDDASATKLTQSSWNHADGHAPTAVSAILKKLQQEKSENSGTKPQPNRNTRTRHNPQMASNHKHHEENVKKLERELETAQLVVKQFAAMDAIKSNMVGRGFIEVRLIIEIDEEPITIAVSSLPVSN
jgi:hypothetical protein